MLLWLSLIVVTAAKAQQTNPNIAPMQSKPHGYTYSEWAARWWQWAFETSAGVNPVTDTTGAYAHEGQAGRAFFLAGAFGASPVECWITIPAGKRLFFLVINAWANILGTPPGTTVWSPAVMIHALAC